MRDSALTAEFYDIVTEFAHRFREAERRSRLPDNPDPEKVEAFVERINRRVVEAGGFH